MQKDQKLEGLIGGDQHNDEDDSKAENILEVEENILTPEGIYELEKTK